jgi:hypothetical protein
LYKDHFLNNPRRHQMHFRHVSSDGIGHRESPRCLCAPGLWSNGHRERRLPGELCIQWRAYRRNEKAWDGPETRKRGNIKVHRIPNGCHPTTPRNCAHGQLIKPRFRSEAQLAVRTVKQNLLVFA